MKKKCLTIIPLMLITFPAYAYLDSGTGSMIIQMLFAAFAGALAMIKIFWQKIKHVWQRFLSIFKGKNQKTADKKEASHDKTK